MRIWHRTWTTSLSANYLLMLTLAFLLSAPEDRLSKALPWNSFICLSVIEIPSSKADRASPLALASLVRKKKVDDSADEAGIYEGPARTYSYWGLGSGLCFFNTSHAESLLYDPVPWWVILPFCLSGHISGESVPQTVIFEEPLLLL